MDTTPEPKPVIAPTVGRVVWYWPSTYDLDSTGGRGMQRNALNQPFYAQVAYVWHDRMVNLSVTDHGGKPFSVTSVMLRQGDEAPPVGGSYAEWMPYQKSQAAHHDAEQAK